MQLMLDIKINSPEKKVSYKDKIALIGSCFTEEIGNRMKELKFSVLQNPNGILYDALSISKNLGSYIENKEYKATDLFYQNEIWQSWQHHSAFSGMDKDDVLETINQSQQTAHEFLRNADWLIITLGSAFSYQLIETKESVANCHKAPGSIFNKTLLKTDEIIATLSAAMKNLFSFNPRLKIILTVSPVKHIKDGIVENSRSKSMLIDAIHELTEKFENTFYFPAYELVTDVLRDHRFYEADLAHPNKIAVDFVFEKFSETFFDTEAENLMRELKQIITAKRHMPFNAASLAHKTFLQTQLQKIKELQQQYSFLDFTEEIKYFTSDNIN